MGKFDKKVAWWALKGATAALGRLNENERRQLGKHLGQARTSQAAKVLAPVCDAFLDAFDGITNRLEVNGEFALLERTAAFGFECLFDVGANMGRWSGHALAHHPRAKVHAFEIVPDTYEQAKANLAEHSDRLQLNALGLMDEAGEVEVFIDPDSHYLATTLAFDAKAGTKARACQVKRGADYAEEQGISGIDVLKIDVEGAEAKVLKGFEPMLATGSIRLIQFEYNAGAIVSGFLLRDFYHYLEPFGYRLGKLYPEGVLFQDYAFDHEDFKGPNYVACLASEPELMAAIALRD